jgi:hypothetical protein
MNCNSEHDQRLPVYGELAVRREIHQIDPLKQIGLFLELTANGQFAAH